MKLEKKKKIIIEQVYFGISLAQVERRQNYSRSSNKGTDLNILRMKIPLCRIGNPAQPGEHCRIMFSVDVVRLLKSEKIFRTERVK